MRCLSCVASLNERTGPTRLHRLPLSTCAFGENPAARGENEDARARLREPSAGQEAEPTCATCDNMSTFTAHACLHHGYNAEYLWR